MTTRRTFLAALLIVPTLLVSMAPARAQGAGEAAAFVRDLAQRAVAIAASDNISREQRLQRYDDLFRSNFALPQISRFVLGRYWRAASEEERRAFVDLFADLTVLTWAERFEGYSGETVEVTQVAPDGDEGWFVETMIRRPEKPPVAAVWRLRQIDGQFRIIDIIIEGVSMAITQRSDYASSIRSAGGIGGLLSTMQGVIQEKRRSLLG